MGTITATELARNLKQVLDHVEFDREEIVITRNSQPIAHLLPGGRHLTALEAMADLHRTLPEDAASGWLEDSRGGVNASTLDSEARDPWAS